MGAAELGSRESLGGQPHLGLCPGLSEQASSSLALGKTFLPGWPGIQTQTKGGFLSRLFVLLPQRLLCAQQKLIRLCSWEALSCWWPVGMAESLAFSLPWRLRHPLPLGLWFPWLRGSHGSPRQALWQGRGTGKCLCHGARSYWISG